MNVEYFVKVTQPTHRRDTYLDYNRGARIDFLKDLFEEDFTFCTFTICKDGPHVEDTSCLNLRLRRDAVLIPLLFESFGKSSL
mmetsp:Transcript_10730/g.13095  ORF Transcript_10730/g.13095 Transcript_10730/m.13095 type:complete len:83 (-) Transcript_10730:230-478(-)